VKEKYREACEKAAQMRNEGVKVSEITRVLNRDGYLTARGKRLKKTNVYNMISSTRKTKVSSTVTVNVDEDIIREITTSNMTWKTKKTLLAVLL
jgi:hypothetical protein